MWAALGSSVTADSGYTEPLAELLGIKLVNLGVSGGSIGQSSNAHYGSLRIYDEIDHIPAGTDLVTIEAGINDFAFGATPLGRLGDTKTATFYGALLSAVEAIHNAHPHSAIVFLTPYAGSYSGCTPLSVNCNGNKLSEFQEAIEDVATFTGSPMIDVGRKSNIGWLTSDKYMKDGLHLTRAGGHIYAEFCASRIKKIAKSALKIEVHI